MVEMVRTYLRVANDQVYILQTACVTAVQLVNHSINMAETSGQASDISAFGHWDGDIWTNSVWMSACVCVCVCVDAPGSKYKVTPEACSVHVDPGEQILAKAGAAIKQMCWRMALDLCSLCVCEVVCVRCCVRARARLRLSDRETFYPPLLLFITIYCIV